MSEAPETFPPTNKVTQIVDDFHAFTTSTFNPITLIEPEQPIKHKNPTLPEMSNTNTTAAQNGKGKKCQPPRDFDGTESKYKTWFRILETYIKTYDHLFPNDQQKISCTLTYMSLGRAAKWAEHFTDEHIKIVQGRGVFDPAMTWAEFIKLLDQTFELRRTKDKARTDLAILRMKSGELKQ